MLYYIKVYYAIPYHTKGGRGDEEGTVEFLFAEGLVQKTRENE